MIPDHIENIVIWMIAFLLSIAFWIAIIYFFNYFITEYFS